MISTVAWSSRVVVTALARSVGTVLFGGMISSIQPRALGYHGRGGDCGPRGYSCQIVSSKSTSSVLASTKRMWTVPATGSKSRVVATSVSGDQ